MGGPMLFIKFIETLKSILKKEIKNGFKRIDAIEKSNYALRKETSREALLKNYLEEIEALKKQKHCTYAAECLVFNIRKDVASNVINLDDLGITDEELLGLFRSQWIRNTSIRFHLLKNPSYRQEIGEDVMREIESLIRGGASWSELNINKDTYRAIKNHIRAAK